MAATLTKDQLKDLHTGVANIKLLNKLTSFAPSTGFDFSGADEIYSVKGTLKITQADPSVNELKIDQGGETIDTTYEKGEFSVTADVPSVAKEVLEYFFAHGSHTTVVPSKIFNTSDADYEGYGYSSEVNRKECSIAIVSESKKTVVIFSNVTFIATFNHEDMASTAVIRVKGNVKGADVSGMETFYVQYKKSA